MFATLSDTEVAGAVFLHYRRLAKLASDGAEILKMPKSEARDEIMARLLTEIGKDYADTFGAIPHWLPTPTP